MENIKIESWVNDNHLSFDYGMGSAVGHGYWYGSGDGACSGNSNGYGDGYGVGYGYGNSSGNGSLRGVGAGRGYAPGTGSDCGIGYGANYDQDYGVSISSINGKRVFNIDSIPTIIERLHGNLAKGYILNRDLILEPCYIAKGEGYFAHGETVKKASDALREKIIENLDEDEAIEKFCEIFKPCKKYPCSDFYEWHHIITRSCEMGRNSFMKNHHISMDDEFTVDEFIKLTENEFGGESIKKLKKYYCDLTEGDNND